MFAIWQVSLVLRRFWVIIRSLKMEKFVTLCTCFIQALAMLECKCSAIVTYYPATQLTYQQKKGHRSRDHKLTSHYILMRSHDLHVSQPKCSPWGQVTWRGWFLRVVGSCMLCMDHNFVSQLQLVHDCPLRGQTPCPHACIYSDRPFAYCQPMSPLTNNTAKSCQGSFPEFN